jgi:polysaccharide biosynthesis/export protein
MLFSSCAINKRDTLSPELDPARILDIPEEVDSAYNSPYLIRYGDRITIGVAGQPTATLNLLVRSDGSISLPYIGETSVVGKTVNNLQSVATEAFSKLYREPSVYVNIDNMAPMQFYVFGEVNSPGVYSNDAPLNLLQVLAVAGGARQGAELRNVVIVDDMGNGEKKVRLVDVTSRETKDLLDNSKVIIDSFDIIIVPSRTITEIGRFVDEYIIAFLPPIDTYLRGRYYWKFDR